MNARGYGLAELGLFLLLAFVLPGFVYLLFLLFLFPSLFDKMLIASGFTNDVALFTIILGFIGGLLLTSVCFSLEILLAEYKVFEKLEKPLHKTKLLSRKHYLFPDMGIPRLAKFEASGKSSLYLHQVTGQAISHFNIAMGLLIMLVIYFAYYYCGPPECTANNLLSRLLITLVVILVNFYVANNFYNWAKGAMDEVEKVKLPMGKL